VADKLWPLLLPLLFAAVIRLLIEGAKQHATSSSIW
jgi:hypothetical protein